MSWEETLQKKLTDLQLAYLDLSKRHSELAQAAKELAKYYGDQDIYEIKELIAQTNVGIVTYESADVDDGEKARAFLAKFFPK